MELKEFQGLALRTESHIEAIKLNRSNLVTLLNIVVAVTEILDGIKKAAFYNKTTKLEDSFGSHLATIKRLADALHSENETVGPVGTIMDAKKTLSNVDPRVFHGIIGIITESGELAQALLKAVDGTKPIDAVNIQEEMSDIAWYKAILHDTLGLDWNQGLINVINKLRIRYPDKYSDYAADNRNLEAERAALEVGVNGVPVTADEDDVRYFKQRIARDEDLGRNTDKLKAQLALLEDALVIYKENRPAAWPLRDISADDADSVLISQMRKSSEVIDKEAAEMKTLLQAYLSGKVDPPTEACEVCGNPPESCCPQKDI